MKTKVNHKVDKNEYLGRTRLRKLCLAIFMNQQGCTHLLNSRMHSLMGAIFFYSFLALAVGFSRWWIVIPGVLGLFYEAYYIKQNANRGRELYEKSIKTCEEI